jgi:hypothetical protein
MGSKALRRARNDGLQFFAFKIETRRKCGGDSRRPDEAREEYGATEPQLAVPIVVVGLIWLNPSAESVTHPVLTGRTEVEAG